MKRWAAAASISLALHSLLLLLPGVDAGKAETGSAFRVVLRGSALPAGDVAESAREQEAPHSPRGEERKEALPATGERESAAVEPAPASTEPPAPPKPERIAAPSAPAAVASPPKARNEAPRPPQPKAAHPPRAGKPEESLKAASAAQESATAEGPTPEDAPSPGEAIKQPAVASSPLAATSSSEPVDVETLRILSRTPPEYPLFSRRRREEGAVHLLLTIRSGRVEDARVANSSGFSRLDEAALNAVKLWRFDHPGEVRARVRIVFRLN